MQIATDLAHQIAQSFETPGWDYEDASLVNYDEDPATGKDEGRVVVQFARDGEDTTIDYEIIVRRVHK